MAEEPSNWITRFGGRDRVILAFLAIGLSLAVGAVAGAFIYREWRAKPARAVGSEVERQGQSRKAGPGSRYQAQFTTRSMYPKFNPDRRFYVTRCAPAKIAVQVNALRGTTVEVAGFPAQTGRFMAEARPLPGQDFEIEVRGSGGPEDGTYRLRCLPSGFPEWSYERFRKPPRGMFVAAFRPSPKEMSRAWVVAFDQDGTPRWWYSPDFNALMGQIFGDGTFQWARGFGDGFGQDSRGRMEVMELDGTPVSTLRTINAPVDGHEFLKLENGNYMVMSYKPRSGVDMSSWGIKGPAGVLTGEIQEVTPEGELIWRWNSWDHIRLDEVPPLWRKVQIGNPHTDPSGLDRYDYFHLNSIQPWRDQIVISTRHTNAVYGISRKTGEVEWKLGGTKTPESLEVVGPDPHIEYPLSGNHDARIVDGNLLTVHDNGTRKRRPPRLVRYRIDPEAGTATYISQATDRKAAPKSKCCGSARKFGSGWITAWGDTPYISGFDSRDRLAFRLRLPAPSYRAMPVPPGVSPLELDLAMDAFEPDFPLGKPIRPIRRFGS